jgi:hypothetical protein
VNPGHVLGALVENAQFLARQAVQGNALERSIIRSEAACWWLDSAAYKNLEKDLKALHGLCGRRAGLYEKLASVSQNHEERAKKLSKNLHKLDPLQKLGRIEADNQALIGDSLSKPKSDRYKPPNVAKRKVQDKRQSGKTAEEIDISVKKDPGRAGLKLRFQDFVDSSIEISQTVTGTNTHLFNQLYRLDEHDLRDKEAYERYLKMKAYYATQLKIADFLIHTKYDPQVQGSVGHWRAWCVGLLCPDVGKIVLADNEDLQVSRFWAGFSDHFPVGGVYSACDNVKETDLLRQAIVRPNDEACVSVNLEKLERSRLLYKAARLLVLSQLLGKTLAIELDQLETGKLRDLVIELEQNLLPPEDRTESGSSISEFDFGWTGVLEFIRYPAVADHEPEPAEEEEEETEVAKQ